VSVFLRKGERESARTGEGFLSPFPLSPFLPLFLLLAACNGPSDGLPVRLDKSNEEMLLRYYLGGYVAPGGADPVEAGLLVTEGGLAVRPEALPEPYRAALRDADGDGTLGWDEFVAFVEATYADARALRPTLDALRADAPYAEGDAAWFTVEVEGSPMTAARRRLYVPVAALRQALAGYREAGDRLVYPEGTVIVGEHREDGPVVETTAKRRRADGFWDFAVYDSDGRLAGATATRPRPLRAPIQCTGCHLGRRLFDPDQSFPAPAPDGPYGPRAILTNDAVRAAAAAHDLAAVFDEHARRSDGVLGLYATLYTARLLADREAGRLAPEDAALLERLGL
jgi:hypothetical protein